MKNTLLPSLMILSIVAGFATANSTENGQTCIENNGSWVPTQGGMNPYSYTCKCSNGTYKYNGLC